MKKKNRRIEWVDIAKFICALFVLLTHLETNTQLLGKIYEPFYLNGFLFLSGYTFTYRDDFTKFIRRKAKQLLIPWLFFGLLVVVTGNIYSPTPDSHHGLIKDLMWFIIQIRERNDAMWFLSALFVAYIPFYFVIRLYLKKKEEKDISTYLLILSFVLYFLSMIYLLRFPRLLFPWGGVNLPWHIEYIPNALFFMLNGYFFRNRFEKYFDRFNKVVTPLLLFVLYIYFLFGGIKQYFLWHFEDKMIYTIICQVIAVTWLVSFSKHIRPNRAILYIGQNSLIYFGIAHYFNTVLQLIIKTAVPSFYTAVLSNEYYSAVFSLIFALISALILILPAYIINTYFPFLVGRDKINKQS